MTTDDILDLRRRVEALEARAAAEESSATEPAQRHPIKPRIGVLNASIKASMDRIQALVADLPEPAPATAADRPLWEVMHKAWNATGVPASDATGYAAEIDAVASWLEQRYLDRYPGAAELLRAEAQRAREGGVMGHPITPPDELVNQWRQKWTEGHGEFGVYLATQAARWGDDQRLEAIRQLLEINGCPREFIDLIINARRPKPPSLKVRIAEAIAKGDKHQALHLLDEALSDD